MWQLYRVVLRLRSPLHVGYLKVGNLMRTRPYVPGKTMWGAITAALAVERFNGDFRRTQQQVSQNLAFSYFYPALNPEDPLWPCYTEEGLCYGMQKMPASEFERRLIWVYGSTALDYSCNAAASGSLHEVEYLSPYDQQEGRPVYLVGYIFERQGSAVPWRDVLDKLRLGGERKSGWGQVVLKEDLGTSSDLFGLTVDLQQERPIVTVKQGDTLYAHALTLSVEAAGEIEPLVGRETQEAGRFGGVLTAHVPICWAPGSRALSDRRLQISEHGVWR